MADPLSLLRQYNIQKKEIIERDNLIIFDQLAWPKTVNTNYVAYRWVLVSGEMRMVFTLCSIFFNYRGKDDESKQCYTLESILFLLKNVKLPHPLYVSRAIVSRFSVFLLVLCYYTVTVLRHYSVQIYVIFCLLETVT